LEDKERSTTYIYSIESKTREPINAEELLKRAKKYFGVTKNPNKAGYVLPDGSTYEWEREVGTWPDYVRAFEKRKIRDVS